MIYLIKTLNHKNNNLKNLHNKKIMNGYGKNLKRLLKITNNKFNKSLNNNHNNNQ